MTVTTEVFYNGNGSKTKFTFPFDYIDQTHIKVGILNVTSGLYEEKAQDDATYGWSLANATTVEFNTAPPAPSSPDPNIKIYRETDSLDPYAVFSPGSPIKAVDLNDNFEQSIYIAQESASVSARAEEVVQTVEALSVQTKAIADQAATDSSAALATATTAQTTADAADTNATDALTLATNAISTATTANSNATTANVNSTQAVADAAQAVSDASTALSSANTAVSTANTAAGDATTALNTANTADTNASAALSTANTALSQSNTAIADSTAATAAANAATQAVANSLNFVQVANIAAIPPNPTNQDAVSVVDSTNINTVPGITGVPPSFAGDPGLTARLIFDGGNWVFQDYLANDPDARYLNPTDSAELLKRDGSVAMLSGASLELDPSGTGGFFFGGAGGKMVKSNNGVKILNGNDLTEIWRVTPSVMRASVDADFTGNITVTGTVDGRAVAADGTKLDGIESGATGDQTASEILDLLKTVDGANSGLDADLLDGQGGTFYLNYNNLTNKPVFASTSLTDSADLVRDGDNISKLSNNVGYLTGISNSAVTTQKIAPQAVTNGKIADGTITPAKFTKTYIEQQGTSTSTYFNGNALVLDSKTSVQSVGSYLYLGSGHSQVRVSSNTRLDLGTGTSRTHSNFGYLNEQGNSGLNAGSQTFDCSMQADGRVVALQFDAKSDRRLKTDFNPITVEEATNFVHLINPTHYQWADGRDSSYQNGYIAQEIGAAGFNNILGLTESDVVDGPLVDETGFSNPQDGYLTVQHNQIIPMLHKALQGALDRITELETRLNELT